MKHIKEYKIFESGENITDIIHECFIPVEDLTSVTVEINKSASFDKARIRMYNLNREICEEIANAVSHCIGMDLYFSEANVYFHRNKINNQGLISRTLSARSFKSDDVEEFYNFITSNDRKNEPSQMAIYFKKAIKKNISNETHKRI